MNSLVLMNRKGPIRTLTLNRPARHNSLVPALLLELLDRLASVQADSEARAVILQANGRSFSTGGDMRGFHEHLNDLGPYASEIVGLLNRVILAMVALPVPIVAAVHGIVTGGSIGLVLAADLALLAPAAGFTPYYSVVGFSPDGGWTAMLPALIGARRTAEILYHNRTVTAEQAVSWGMANRIVVGEDVRDAALRAAQDVAQKRAGSVQQIKRLLANDNGSLAERLERERAHFVQQILTAEARQGIVAFQAQREKQAGA